MARKTFTVAGLVAALKAEMDETDFVQIQSRLDETEIALFALFALGPDPVVDDEPSTVAP